MMWGAISFAGTKDFEVNTPPTAGPLAQSDCPAGFHYPSARARAREVLARIPGAFNLQDGGTL